MLIIEATWVFSLSAIFHTTVAIFGPEAGKVKKKFAKYLFF